MMTLFFFLWISSLDDFSYVTAIALELFFLVTFYSAKFLLLLSLDLRGDGGEI